MAFPAFTSDIKWGTPRNKLSGVCASDQFWDGNVYLFRGDECKHEKPPHVIKGSSVIADFKTIDMGRDNLNDVLVPPNYEVTLYNKKDFNGKLVTLGPGFHRLKDYGARNKTDSLKARVTMGLSAFKKSCCAGGYKSNKWGDFCSPDYNPDSPYSKCPTPEPSSTPSTTAKEPPISTSPAPEPTPEPTPQVHTSADDPRNTVITSQEPHNPEEPDAIEEPIPEDPAPVDTLTPEEINAIIGESEEDTNTGLIVGVSLGSLLLILLIIGGIIFFKRRNKY